MRKEKAKKDTLNSSLITTAVKLGIQWKYYSNTYLVTSLPGNMQKLTKSVPMKHSVIQINGNWFLHTEEYEGESRDITRSYMLHKV